MKKTDPCRLRCRGARDSRGCSGRRAALCLAAVLSGWMFPGEASCHAFDLFGFGSRAIGMGGAYSAVADDFTATYYNPAGLTRSKHLVIGMGYSAILSDLELNGEGLDLGDADFSGVSGGLSASGEANGHGFGFGIGFSLPDQAIVRTRLLATTQPRFVLLSDRTQRGEVNFAGALRVLSWLSVGAGVACTADMGGSIRLQGNLFPEDLSGKLVVDIKNRLWPVGGILLEPVEKMSLGVSYRGEMSVSVRIPMVASFTVTDDGTEAIEVPPLLISQTHFYSPQQVTLGASYEPTSDWTVSLDIEWANWSAKERAVIEPSTPESDELVEPAFHDIVIPRVGVEHRWNPMERLFLAFRAGYGYEPSPVPAPTGVFNYLDNDKHVGAIGLGVGYIDRGGILPSPLTLDVHAQYMRFVRRQSHKDDPNDPVGDLDFGGERLGLGAVLNLNF